MLFAASGAQPAQAQEFNCTVSLNMQSLSGGSDYSFLNQLRDDLREYINNGIWTDDRFDVDERIECSFDITIMEAITLTRFRANAVVSSKRPIYGSSQTTRVVTIADEGWIFDYTQGTQIVSNPDRFDELTTFVDYYLYLLLGYDYDTFTELGGTPYFERARRLADLGKSQNGAGWSEISADRTRVSIVRELLDPRFSTLRAAYFKYHYTGLDHFIRDPETSRDEVLTTIQEIKNLAEVNARSYAIDLFFAAKSEELAAIFKGSLQSGPAYDILADVDPSHLNNYSPLIN